MKKFFAVAILSAFMFCKTVFAADIWILTTFKGADKFDWYIQSENIVEDADKKIFEVSLKLVMNGRLSDTHRQTFSFVDNIWYVKQSNSGQTPQEVNTREIYQKMFDACTPYCKLAQNYPR